MLEIEGGPVQVLGMGRGGKAVVLCDHASPVIPPALNDLGLTAQQRLSHIAWDPGAAPLARLLAEALDAPLVLARVSRLVVDLNRLPEDPDAIPFQSEQGAIPGNEGLDAAARAERIEAVHKPYHATVSALLKRTGPRAVIAVHSFTPIWRGQARPWHLGVLSNKDRSLAEALLVGLAGDPALVLGDNQPYSPADRVYRTLDRHAEVRGWPSVMLELRSDQLAAPELIEYWSRRLSAVLKPTLAALPGL